MSYKKEYKDKMFLGRLSMPKLINSTSAKLVGVKNDGSLVSVDSESVGGVESVSGSLVDNTDPNNPVIDNPTVQNGLDIVNDNIQLGGEVIEDFIVQDRRNGPPDALGRGFSVSEDEVKLFNVPYNTEGTSSNPGSEIGLGSFAGDPIFLRDYLYNQSLTFGSNKVDMVSSQLNITDRGGIAIKTGPFSFGYTLQANSINMGYDTDGFSSNIFKYSKENYFNLGSGEQGTGIYGENILLGSDSGYVTVGGTLRASQAIEDNEVVTLGQFQGIVNDTLTNAETSATLQALYSTSVVGTTVTAPTALREYTKISPTQWSKKTIEII